MASTSYVRPLPQPTVAQFDDYQPWTRTTRVPPRESKKDGDCQGSPDTTRSERTTTEVESVVTPKHFDHEASLVADKKEIGKKPEVTKPKGKTRRPRPRPAVIVKVPPTDVPLRHPDSVSVASSSLPTDGVHTRCSLDRGSRVGSILLNTFIVERPSRIRFGAGTKQAKPAALQATLSKTKTKTKGDRKKEELERARVLQVKIKNLRDLYEQQKERQNQLEKEIFELEMAKTEREDQVYGDVKGLLRRYEKFRGSVFAINSQAYHEREESQNLLEKAKKRCKRKISELEKQLLQVEEKLKEKRDQLQVLQTYKDKEYPAKALKIAELQKEIDLFNIANREDKTELQAIITGEMRRMNQQHVTKKQHLTLDMTSRAITNLPPLLKNMMVENAAMTKEIALHKTAQVDLIREIESIQSGLETIRAAASAQSTAATAPSTAAAATAPSKTAAGEAASLGTKPKMSQPKTVFRKGTSSAPRGLGTLSASRSLGPFSASKGLGVSRMFPEIFDTRPPCDPDAEVVLDIPKQIALPI